MTDPGVGTTMRLNRLRTAGMSLLAIGALAFGACSDDDGGGTETSTPDTQPGAGTTVPGVPTEPGPNQPAETPDFPPKIDEAARFAEEAIRADFAERAWMAAVVEVVAEDTAMVMIMDTSMADLDDEALLEACTALAAEAFADTGLDPVVIEARLEDLEGNELRSADGPQCV